MGNGRRSGMTVFAAAVFAASLGACGGDDDAPDAAIVIDATPIVDASAIDADPDAPGRFALSWTLEQGGAPTTCAAVGATGVSLLSTLEGQTAGVEDIFACENGSGVTGTFPLGDYTVVANVLGSGDVPIASSLPQSESLTQPGRTLDIGNFVFDF